MSPVLFSVTGFSIPPAESAQFPSPPLLYVCVMPLERDTIRTPTTGDQGLDPVETNNADQFFLSKPW